MRGTLITLLNICLFIDCFSQDYHKIDSLKQILYSTHDDTTKGLAILQLAHEYMWTLPDTCLYYTNMGLDLIRDESIKNKFERSENPSLYSFETDMYATSSTALSEQRNDSLAVKIGLKALQLAEKSKDTLDIYRVYIRLGETYENIGEPSIAINYYKKLLSVDTSSDINVWIGLIGSSFYALGNYDSALYYLNKIDPLFKQEEGKYWPVPPLYLGKIYTKKSNYKKALSYFRTAINYSEQAHNRKDACDAYIGISEAFKRMGITDSALLCAAQALKIANELSLPTQSLDAGILLSSIYELKGKIDSALKYQKISMALKDSLFSKEKIKQIQNYSFNEQLRQQEEAEQQRQLQNKIKLYSLLVALAVFLVIAFILYRSNRHKQKAYALLQKQKQEIDTQKAKVEQTLEELKSTQAQLIQQEKMASLGELTAGIAHEIQNPLNFVNNFSEVNTELIDELKGERSKVDGERNEEIEDEILNDIKQNIEKILHHGKRADAIVKGMLQHSRVSTGQKEPTDINALADEYLRLSYHGMRAKDKNFNATFKTDFDATIGKINIVPQDIGRVLLNLFNNAFYAVSERRKVEGVGYEPVVSVSTKRSLSFGEPVPTSREGRGEVEIKVADNGTGIPQKVIDKIFQPFFTTKPTAQGTGLGLSLSYDIIKAHGGEIRVDTRENEGSEFVIQLPTK